MTPPLLQVSDLTVDLSTAQGRLRALDGVSFTLQPGQTLGLVGESGSGKSMACRAVIRLLPPSATVTGSVRLDDKELLGLGPRGMRRVRGREIAMIMQDPLASLNPAFTVGNQVAEAIAVHQDVRGRELRQRTVEILHRVGIPAPERRLDNYPHQLSGGMRQRVVGAIALSCRPRVLLADEPTTSLDPTIQLQFLRLLRDLQQEFGFAMVFVTHDLGIISRVCDRVAVMYAGRIVETADTTTLFTDPGHPYTRALLDSRPAMDDVRRRLPSIAGTVPRPIDLPAGCTFAPRCTRAMPTCRTTTPGESMMGAGHLVRCWLHEHETTTVAHHGG